MKQEQKVEKSWKLIAPYAEIPSSDAELEEKIAHLDELLELVGEDENHPLIGLVDLISQHIQQYEEKRFHQQHGSGVDALKYLMEVHQLTQMELPEVGSQGVVSEVLRGKRKLNRRQIEQLSQRFKVSPTTFFD